MTRKPDTTPAPPEREQRSYPHGSGDRNSFSPFGKDRTPRHEGGTQRHAPPAPDGETDGETDREGDGAGPN